MKTKLIIALATATVISGSTISTRADGNASANGNNSDAVRTDTSNQNPTPDNSRNNNNYNSTQTDTTRNSQNYQRDRDEARASRWQRLGDLSEARQVIGLEVKDSQNEKLGKVKDLALDLQNGRIVEVVVARGGMLGLDEKYVAVPPSAFTYDATSKVLTLDTSRDQFKNAPEFQWSHWKDATDDSQVRDVYQRFGAQPYYGQAANWNTNNTDYTHSSTGTTERTAGNNTYTNNSTLANNANGQPGQGQDSRYYPMNGDAANSTNRSGARGYIGMASDMPATMGYVERASKVLGASAVNNQNEKVGKVKDIVIDLRAGRIVEIVLASGGFLGIDSELSAVPPQSFKYNSENSELTLDTSRETLKSAPHFKANDWQTANDPSRVSEVYSTYHVQPYFANRDMDNTAQNVRDRSGNTLTPLDQGNSKEDLNTTAQIRKAIRMDNNSSVNAQNVKIITINGRVTLRGVVNSDEEKRMIVEQANKVASADKVDDQLQVRGATPTSTDSNNK